MIGHRSIYHDGWRAVCPWPGPSFAEAKQPFGAPISADTLSELDASGWELYHVDEDFAETKNVAADNRDRLIALIGTWYAEAGKYNVLPVDGSALARLLVERPLLAAPRDRYVYFPDTQSVPYFAAPKVLNRPHSITADVEIPDGGAEGVLLCQGAVPGGYSLFMQGRQARLRAQLRRPRLLQGGVRRRGARRPARAALRVRTDRRAEPARGQGCPGPLPALRRRHARRRDRRALHDADDPEPGCAHLRLEPGLVDHAPTTPARSRFTGTIHSVTIDVSGDLVTDTEAEMRVAMARQ